jgi:oligopeptide transport system substrate-binding protein
MSPRARNIFLLSLGAAIIAAAAFAFSRGTLPPADFTFVNGTELKTLDPHNVAGVPEGRIVWELFEGLCRWDPKTLEARPGVAERWDVSDDGLTYTFHLRDNAKWSDGSPVVADDFLWSFRRLLHPAIAAEYAYELWYVTGAKEFSTLDVNVGDPVEIELIDRPKGALPFADGEIVRGKLVSIDSKPGEKGEKVYVVEIDGKNRRFAKGGGKGLEDYRWLLYDFKSIGIEAPDQHTIVFHLDNPVPYFAMLMGYYPLYPVNRRCLETYGSPAWNKPENIVTNGPFHLQSRRIRDRVRLVKSPTYWDRDNVKLNTIDALAVESETTSLNLYLTGKADYIEYIPQAVIGQLKKSGRPDFMVEPWFGTYMYRLNVTHKPLNDVRVRRALNLAVDKQTIVDRITQAGQIPARSLVPTVLSQYMPYQPQLCGQYDVAEARRLLAESGFPGGEGFPKLRLLYNPLDMHAAIGQVVQAQWKENLGIDIELEQQEWGSYQSAQRTLNYDIARYAWIGDYPDPATFLKMFVTGGGNNQTGWGNPEYDKLIDSAQKERDPNKRLEYFQQAERILMDELPIIPLYYYVTTDMYGPYVHGIYGNMQNIHPLKEVWVDKEEKARFDPQRPQSASPPVAEVAPQ